mmetsp:Transcript_17008/g.33233  ORF Transcript_17008/g.33233 Transcript_17008/m.33233 type:complete len:287 (-) Transcript_17008:190-1050(-)
MLGRYESKVEMISHLFNPCSFSLTQLLRRKDDKTLNLPNFKHNLFLKLGKSLHANEGAGFNLESHLTVIFIIDTIAAKGYGIAWVHGTNTRRSASKDDITLLKGHGVSNSSNELGHIKNHICNNIALTLLPINRKPKLNLLWVGNQLLRNEWTKREEGVEALSSGPRQLLTLGLILKRATSNINSNGISGHMVKRLFERHLGCLIAANYYSELDLVVHLTNSLRKKNRIRHLHNAVGWLKKPKRVLRELILQLLGMVYVIATNCNDCARASWKSLHSVCPCTIFCT